MTFVFNGMGMSDPLFYNLAKTILDGLREIKIIKNTK